MDKMCLLDILNQLDLIKYDFLSNHDNESIMRASFNLGSLMCYIDCMIEEIEDLEKNFD